MKLKDLVGVIPGYGGVEVRDMHDSGTVLYYCMWNEKFEPPYALLDEDVRKIYGDLDYCNSIDDMPDAITVIELEGDAND